jgi:hypothetical protein
MECGGQVVEYVLYAGLEPGRMRASVFVRWNIGFCIQGGRMEYRLCVHEVACMYSYQLVQVYPRLLYS